ncbi:MAG: YicC/YloC family endoribonuclease [Gammaproteobacteria bacterium]|jgi:uncharacterized protein (TIGR00255 family)|nr:YicC/YloC family endoribonuclease [Gammaproteobacteria bacterium]
MLVIYSMTGFASGETSTSSGTLLWELRSVNHRYLECSFRLPDGFRVLEAQLREQVGERLQRGKLDATLQFRPAAETVGQLRVNTALAASVIAAGERLNKDIENPAMIAALDVLRWPGVVLEDKLDVRSLFEPAAALLDDTLDTLIANRAREGARLQAALEDRLQRISALTAEVRAAAPQVVETLRGKLRERAAALAVRLDPERLEQELVLLAQKMDVAEELDRLDAHIAESRAAFEMPGAIGRRLDFLMQEFNREANTLGSKSADAVTSKAAVELKVLIEQLREQVQNIE